MNRLARLSRPETRACPRGSGDEPSTYEIEAAEQGLPPRERG